MLKKNFIRFFILLLLFSAGFASLQATDKKSIDQRPVERIEWVEQILTEKEQLSPRQYDELRTETLRAIHGLEQQKQELQTKVHRSSGDRKSDLENQLSQVMALIDRAEHQLQIINKEKIQTQAATLFSIRNPLYKPDFAVDKTIEMIHGIKAGALYLVDYPKNFSSNFFAKNQILSLLSSAFSFSMMAFLFWLSKRKVQKWRSEHKKGFSHLFLLVIRGILDTLFLTSIIIPILSLLENKENVFDISHDPGVTFVVKVGLVLFLLLRWVQLGFKNPELLPIKSLEKNRLTTIRNSLYTGIPLIALNLLLHHFDAVLSFAILPIFGIQVAIAAVFMTLASNLKISPMKKAFVDLLLLAFPLMIFFGFFPLSQYIFEGTLGTLGAYALLKFSHKMISFGIDAIFVNDHLAFTKISIEEKSQKLIKHWTSAVFVILSGLVFAYLTLLIWGVDRIFVNDWMKMLFFGVKIGGFTFSLVHLFIGLVVFSAVLILTRYFQLVLEKHVFPYTNIDVSLRHTLTKTTGYIGMALASLLGVSSMGVNIASLYFILGGLSVGVGLGLQQIVMNFLSGLVMLIERPVKIGDIVDVAGEYGTVRTINVRTTEIETSDKSIVILPNSYIINNMIKNWTKQNRMRRSEIKIKVARESDTNFITNVFLGVFEECPFVLSDPAPKVYFQEILDGCYLFIIHYYIGEVADNQAITSKVHHMLHEACQKHNIILPHPQFDFQLLSAKPS